MIPLALLVECPIENPLTMFPIRFLVEILFYAIVHLFNGIRWKDKSMVI